VFPFALLLDAKAARVWREVSGRWQILLAIAS